MIKNCVTKYIKPDQFQNVQNQSEFESMILMKNKVFDKKKVFIGLNMIGGRWSGCRSKEINQTQRENKKKMGEKAIAKIRNKNVTAICETIE